MTGIYLAISIGAAGFLIWIIIDSLKVFSGLKPKVDQAKREAQEYQELIEAEQSVTKDTNQEVKLLRKEIGDLEKDLEELSKQVEQFSEKEKRRKRISHYNQNPFS